MDVAGKLWRIFMRLARLINKQISTEVPINNNGVLIIENHTSVLIRL